MRPASVKHELMETESLGVESGREQERLAAVSETNHGRIPCIDISCVSILGVFRLRACQHHGGRISPGAALNMTDGKVRLPPEKQTERVRLRPENRRGTQRI